MSEVFKCIVCMWCIVLWFYLVWWCVWFVCDVFRNIARSDRVFEFVVIAYFLFCIDLVVFFFDCCLVKYVLVLICDWWCLLIILFFGIVWCKIFAFDILVTIVSRTALATFVLRWLFEIYFYFLCVLLDF